MKFLHTIFLFSLFLCYSCTVTRPDAGMVSTPDYNSRVEVTDAHYDHVLTPYGVGTIVAGTVAGAYMGYQSSMFTHYSGKDKQVTNIGGMIIGSALGYYVTKYINYAFGWRTVTYPASPQEWIDRTNKEFLLTRQTDNSNFVLTHVSTENKFVAKNIQDARDFKKVFPISSFTNNVVGQTVINGGFRRKDYIELMQLFPNNPYLLDMKKNYVNLSSNVTELFSAIDNYPETKLNVEKKAAGLVNNYSDATLFHIRYTKSYYNNQVIINTLDNSSESEVYNLYSVFKNDFYLSSNDFKSYTSSDLGRKKYSNALFRIKSPRNIYDIEGFYHEYDWLQYSDKPSEIISNYWDFANSSYSDGNLVLNTLNNLASDNTYAKWNITKSNVNSFVASKLENIIKTQISYKLSGLISPKTKGWSDWVNNNNMTAGWVKISNLSYLISGTVVNNSKFDLPLKLTLSAEVYKTNKVEGLAGFAADILLGTNQSTHFLYNYNENYYVPSLKNNQTHTFAVVFDVGNKSGYNLADWGKLTTEIEVKNVLVKNIQYSDENINQSIQNKQNSWLNIAKNGIPDAKLIDRWRNEEYQDDVWKKKHEYDQAQKRQAKIEAEKRRVKYEQEYQKDLAEQEKTKNDEKKHDEEQEANDRKQKEEQEDNDRKQREEELKKVENIADCIKDFEDNLVLSDSTNSAITTYGIKRLVPSPHTLDYFYYRKKDSPMGTEGVGWYIQYGSVGPYNSKSDAIKKYCEDKYKK